MTPAAILARLSKLGVLVTAGDDKLRLDGYGQKPPPVLIDELRAHAPEVLSLVRHGGGWPRLRDVLGGSLELQPRDRGIVHMPLERFASARLVVAVTSEVLDGPILLASDNAILDPGERRPVYRAAEIRELLGLSPKDLRQVHRVKVIFGGTVEPS